MSLKKAVIVAAGQSSRLYPRTLNCPKALLELGGKSIIARSLDALEKMGLSEIAVVTGFKSEQFDQQIGTRVKTLFNPFFAHCNNMGSLWFARHFVGNEPFVYLHADIVYPMAMLQAGKDAFEKDTAAIELVCDYKPTDAEAMKVRVDCDDMLLESNKEIALDQAKGEWTGIAFIRDSNVLFQAIEYDLKTADLNHYDTFTFSRMAREGRRIHCVATQHLPWTEIDFENDLQEAEQIVKTLL